MTRRLLLLVCCVMFVAGWTAQTPTKKSAAAPAAAKPFSIPPRACGNKDASVVVEVYTDFECPHCAILYRETLKPMMKDYCTSGKIYFIHRDFPLPGHRFSREASRWVLAAATIGKNEQLTEQLFLTQPTWQPMGNIEQAAAGVLSAAEIAKVKQVMAAHKDEIEAEIDHDVTLGKQANLDQTPTTVIKRHGLATSQTAGGIPYSRLKIALDSLIDK
jgi:protein-disulfide isomerase